MGSSTILFLYFNYCLSVCLTQRLLISLLSSSCLCCHQVNAASSAASCHPRPPLVPLPSLLLPPSSQLPLELLPPSSRCHCHFHHAAFTSITAATGAAATSTLPPLALLPLPPPSWLPLALLPPPLCHLW